MAHLGPLDRFWSLLDLGKSPLPKSREREREMFRSRIFSHLRRNKTLATSFISRLKDSSYCSSSSRVLNERFRFLFASKSSNSNSFSGWNSFYAFRSLQKVRMRNNLFPSMLYVLLLCMVISFSEEIDSCRFHFPL